MDQLGHLLNLQRLERIRSSIFRYLEGAQTKVGNRFDSKMKRVLKEAYDLLEGVRVEIEMIQGNILKLLKPVRPSKKPAGVKKKKPVSMKTSKAFAARSAQKSRRTSGAQTRA